MAHYDTVANIVSDAAIELGLASAPIADPFGSTNKLILQLCAFLKSEGRRLVGLRDWSQLRTASNGTLDGSIPALELPAGTARFVDDSLWNSTTQQKWPGPITAALWARLRNTNPVFDLPPFRLQGNYILFVSNPAPCGVDYATISRYFVSDTDTDFPDSETPENKDQFIFLDSPMVVKALKLAYLRAKGFDTTAAQQDFDEAYATAAGNNNAGAVLNVGRRRGGRLIDACNLPENGYGS